MRRFLIDRLPARIARLEAQHGSDDPYLKDLKARLRASIANQGKSAHDVFRAQILRSTVSDRAPNPGTPVGPRQRS